MEEHGEKRVNTERAAELTATGAAVAAVGCPFCATMLADGVKSLALAVPPQAGLSDGMRANGDAVEVKDVAILLDEATV